ncbi:MAG TPA: hypothetical protein ENJ82_03545 [Bacteroidetes bacterium]|nr:hypothetical protein [Bacteroidota bacterium]
MRRKRINNRKRSGNQTWLLTLAVPILVLGIAILLSPGESTAEPLEQESSKVESYQEGRHYDYFVKDSILNLLQAVDPTGKYARIDSSEDSLIILITEGVNDQRARIVMLRNRSLRSLKKMLGSNSPFSVKDSGSRSGLYLPIANVNGTEMIPIPYDMLAGLLAEKTK